MTDKLKFSCWITDTTTPTDGLRFMRDGEGLPDLLQQFAIILEQGDEARATELLMLGAGRVLLADAALLDSAVIGRLAQQFGSERIGIYLPTKKMEVSWAIDYISNEDFNCITPSYGKASWVVLKSDGSETGTDVAWWVAQMLELGATSVLIGIDMHDGDLNICADLVENYGDKLWFTTLHQPDADFEPWVRYGQVRQLLLPYPNNRDEAEMTRIIAAALSVAQDEITAEPNVIA